MILKQGNHSSLAVSLLFHGALLVFFGLFVIAPNIQPKWFELELRDPLRPWVEETHEIMDGPESTKPGTSYAASPAEQSETQNRASQTSQAALMGSPTAGSQYPETIEPPSFAHASELPARMEPGSDVALRGSLNGSGSGDQSSGGGVSISVRGGNVRFRLPLEYKHSLGAPGTVVIQFKLDKYARPIINSIEPIQQTGPRYYEAARKALLDGKFTFEGAPEPGVTCQITMEFL